MHLEAAAEAELKAAANAQAADESKANEVDAAQAKADILSERLRGMFEDPKAAMKQMFEDMLQYLAKAIIQSLILGKNMGGIGGGGGGF